MTWLRKESFPEVNTSEEIITSLANNLVGTDNKNIIEKIICPETRPYLTITINWPDKPDGFEVKISKQVQKEQKQYVYTQT